jgi:hypothetical protein
MTGDLTSMIFCMNRDADGCNVWKYRWYSPPEIEHSLESENNRATVPFSPATREEYDVTVKI